jgi:peptide-methionine (S)-S-oxide reductase
MNQFRVCVGSVLLGVTMLVAMEVGRAAAPPVKLPTATLDDTATAGQAKATIVLAGGCFWGVEEVFQHVKGVVDAVSGYSGGSARNANYDMVSTGTSGHAESVKVTYDPTKITLGQIFKVFFSGVHDPTQLNRQGPDVGPQYRSAIFYANERQEQIARAYIQQLEAAHVFKSKIVTQLVPLSAFYNAEEDHQDFAAKNPFHRYIVFVDKPKVDDLRKEFAAIYR